MRRRAAALLALLAFTAPAQGQNNCDDRAKLLAGLKAKYNETPIFMGPTNAGGVLELLVSPHGESWTILITHPNGLTCVATSGENLEAITAKQPGEDS